MSEDEEIVPNSDLPVETHIIPIVSIDEMKLIRKVGSGTYGSCWKVRYNHQDQDMIFKRANNQTNYQHFRHLMNEIDILQKLNHDNIINIMRIVKHRGATVGYLMKPADLSLYSYVKAKCITRIPNKGKILVAKDLAKALEYLQYLRYPIVHGNVSPNNVLVNIDDNGALKNVILGDFGGAGMVDDPDRIFSGGTSPFQSKEQYLYVTGDRSQTYGCEADVHAYGTVLYFTCSRNIPFEEDYDPTLRRPFARACDRMHGLNGHKEERPALISEECGQLRHLIECTWRPGHTRNIQHVMNTLNKWRIEAIQEFPPVSNEVAKELQREAQRLLSRLDRPNKNTDLYHLDLFI